MRTFLQTLLFFALITNTIDFWQRWNKVIQNDVGIKPYLEVLENCSLSNHVKSRNSTNSRAGANHYDPDRSCFQKLHLQFEKSYTKVLHGLSHKTAAAPPLRPFSGGTHTLQTEQPLNGRKRLCARVTTSSVGTLCRNCLNLLKTFYVM